MFECLVRVRNPENILKEEEPRRRGRPRNRVAENGEPNFIYAQRIFERDYGAPVPSEQSFQREQIAAREEDEYAIRCERSKLRSSAPYSERSNETFQQEQQQPGWTRFICFTDESRFIPRGVLNKQNDRFWAADNPKWVRDVEYQDRWSVNVWGGIVGDRLVGPVILDATMNGETYLDTSFGSLPLPRFGLASHSLSFSLLVGCHCLHLFSETIASIACLAAASLRSTPLVRSTSRVLRVVNWSCRSSD
ncbi:hypothetical protein TKK_0018205 [Trichogramma kaykai]